MNRKLIIHILGAILLLESAAMLPSFCVAAYYRDGDLQAMTISILVTALLGSAMWFCVRPEKGAHLRLKEGFLIVAFGWLVMSLCGALPYMFSGAIPRWEDALFESVSGFTTTGASIVTRFEGFPRGVMLWRVTTHWVGGMGVLVLMLALLPRLTGRSSHLVLAESPGPSLSKLVPHTASTAKLLYRIYIALTLLEIIALLLCGLSPYDAILHALSTAGTGGFSNYGASIAAFDSVAVELVISAFMFLFGINFALYYKLIFVDHFRAFTRDEEFRWYACISFGLILLLAVFNSSYYHNFWTSLRYSTFELLATTSTTGFVTADYTQWPVASHLIIILAMFMGSCAGSTAGGMKVIRVALLFKLCRRSVRTSIQPKKVQVIRMDGRAVEENMLTQVSLFAIMYAALVLAGGFLLSLDGQFDAITHLTASLTCVSNIGPGFGAVYPLGSFADYGIWGKLVASALMLFGRLELIPMFMLFTRSAWHKY